MANEIATLGHNYSSLHKKVDIIVDAITKVVEWYHSLIPHVEKMAEDEVNSFGSIKKVLVELKALVLKFGFVSSLLITPELLSEKFQLLESTIQKELAPLAEPINLMPTNAPPVNTWMKGGDMGGVGIGLKFGTRGSGSSRIDDDAKVAKVLTTQIPTSLPKTSTITSSSTTKPITKGIVIRYASGGSSSSKPTPTTEEMQNTGKGIFTEPSVDKKKAAIEKEMEKQRQIQSILRQRENDPPYRSFGCNRGDA